MTCHVHRNRGARIVAAAVAGGASWLDALGQPFWDMTYATETPVDLSLEVSPYTLSDGVELILTNHAGMDTAEINAVDGIKVEHLGAGVNPRVGVDIRQALTVLGLPAYDSDTDAFFAVQDITLALPSGSAANTSVFSDIQNEGPTTERLRCQVTRDNTGTGNIHLNSNLLDADPSRNVNPGPVDNALTDLRTGIHMIGRTLRGSYDKSLAGAVVPPGPFGTFFFGLNQGRFSPRIDDNEGSHADPTSIEARVGMIPGTVVATSFFLSRTRLYRWI